MGGKSMEKEKELDLEKNKNLDIDDILQVLNSWDFKPIPTEQDEKKEEQSYVRISLDRMEAWLYLAPPLEGEIYTKEVILSIAEAHGVKAGFIHSSINAMIKKKIYCRETKIAKGMTAVAGKNGYYQFFFVTEEKVVPQYHPDGSVDYSSFHDLQSVEKDDILAIYHPAEQGTAGYNVQGKFLPLKPGKDLLPLQGRGFYRSDGSNSYFASVDGKVEYKNGVLDIRSIHIVDEDVTTIQGKIEFFGDIVIHGNVESGVSIRTAKTLTIDGTVGACNIYAGGDIVLKKGIQGANKAKVVTKGNLLAEFIEHANVEAQVNVKANIIMNSIINAEGKVFLTGTKGTLLGGYTHALEAIEANSMGNSVEIRTLVHVGCKPDVMDKRKALAQMEKSLREELSDLARQVKQLERYKATNSEAVVIESEMQSLTLQKRDLVIKLEKLKQDMNLVATTVKKASKAYIKVDGPIYRGVTVCVDDNQFTVNQNTSFMRYTNVAGKLSPTVLVD